MKVQWLVVVLVLTVVVFGGVTWFYPQVVRGGVDRVRLVWLDREGKKPLEIEDERLRLDVTLIGILKRAEEPAVTTYVLEGRDWVINVDVGALPPNYPQQLEGRIVRVVGKQAVGTFFPRNDDDLKRRIDLVYVTQMEAM